MNYNISNVYLTMASSDSQTWTWRQFDPNEALALPTEQLYIHLRFYWIELRDRLRKCLLYRSHYEWHSEILPEVNKIQRLFERVTSLNSYQIKHMFDTYPDNVYRITEDELMEKFIKYYCQ